MATYRIVSFDGGGIRGLLTTTVLERLDVALPGWLDRAQLLAGNSTGGIIALGLASGLSAASLSRLYYDKGPVIFGERNELGTREKKKSQPPRSWYIMYLGKQQLGKAGSDARYHKAG